MSYQQDFNRAMTSNTNPSYYTGAYAGSQADADKLRNMAVYASTFGANQTANRLEARANNVQQSYNQHIANGDHLQREKSGNYNWYSQGAYWK